MKIEVSDEICKKYNLSIKEALVLIGLKYSSQEIFQKLNKERFLLNLGSSIFNEETKYRLSRKANEVLSCILAESTDVVAKRTTNIEELANKLRDIYPNGKIINSNYYYRCNKQDVINKLKTFFKMYGTKYTDEQIINATQKYIDSFNGNYAYLKLLKYFIWKDERLKGESVQSLLADFIENENVEDTPSTDWTVELK